MSGNFSYGLTLKLFPLWLTGAQLDLIMPQETFEVLRDEIVTNGTHPRHYKVNMKLEHILQGEFFSEYIKKGITFFYDCNHDFHLTNMLACIQGTFSWFQKAR